jgi:hypothetical protein
LLFVASTNLYSLSIFSCVLGLFLIGL